MAEAHEPARSRAPCSLRIGRAHIAEGYSQHATISGCWRAAISTASGSRRGHEFEVPRRTASLRQVLWLGDLTVFDVCTPPTLHVAETLAAIAADNTDLREPLAGSLAEVD